MRAKIKKTSPSTAYMCKIETNHAVIFLKLFSLLQNYHNLELEMKRLLRVLFKIRSIMQRT